MWTPAIAQAMRGSRRLVQRHQMLVARLEVTEDNSVHEVYRTTTRIEEHVPFDGLDEHSPCHEVLCQNWTGS